MLLVLTSVALLGVGAVAAALLGRSDRGALAVGTLSSVLACGLGVAGSIVTMLGHTGASLRLAWPMPFGELHLALDALSAFFLLCICIVSGLAAVYGAGYLQAFRGKRRLAPAVVFFNLLVAAMVVLVAARDGVLFLVAWEVMSISSFFLVTYENDREEVRRAGMTYLIASQAGVALLFVVFTLLAADSGSFDFDRMLALGVPARGLASVLFVLAVIGFGTKAGFWPVHIWLPDAHPAAPSHVSALMSGVMIKMGIYGLLRVLTLLGPPQAWWGVLVVAVGAVSGVAGVLHALAQHDLKRLLAYHSVENVGIITLGIGVGMLGQSLGNPAVAFLGHAGALLHTLNHGLFKGLLFHGAGSVLHGAGTRDIDSLGALARRMPTTALTFLVASVAICGLPPLNGFVSEWLIYVGAFRAGSALPAAWALCALCAVPALALIGGLAAACFVKAFGVVFLGEPRSDAAVHAHEAGLAMRAPMILGAALCLGIGLWPAGAIRLVAPAAASLAQFDAVPAAALGPLSAVSRVAVVLILLVAFLALVRAWLLRGREVGTASTWGCGYAAPTARMQYTGASFAQPLLAPFASVLHCRVHRDGPSGFFPTGAHYHEHVGDMAGEQVLVPAARRFVEALSRVRVIQQGRIQLYLVYVLATLVALLVWQLVSA